METNSNSKLVAALLQKSGGATFTGLFTTKQGVVRGGQRYGDDTIHTVVVTGFSYENLVKKSLAKLPSVTTASVIASAASKGLTITEEDVKVARGELEASFQSSLDGTNEATTDHVYDSLVVDGSSVRGSRVYKCTGQPKCKCRACTQDPKAPLDGTIYLQGLRIWSEVLTPAANGSAPAPKSKSKTIAKNALRETLPVSRYVSYRLEPGQNWILRAGGTAEVEATKKGFLVTDAIVNTLSQAV